MSRHHASRSGARSRAWQRLRIRVFERDGWRCISCGRAGRLECHHVTPLDAGGADLDPDNLVTLCRDCHFDTHRELHPDLAAWRDHLKLS